MTPDEERRAAYVAKCVNEAPPLTAEQRDKLAQLLRPAREQILAARKAQVAA